MTTPWKWARRASLWTFAFVLLWAAAPLASAQEAGAGSAAADEAAPDGGAAATSADDGAVADTTTDAQAIDAEPGDGAPGVVAPPERHQVDEGAFLSARRHAAEAQAQDPEAADADDSETGSPATGTTPAEVAAVSAEAAAPSSATGDVSSPHSRTTSPDARIPLRVGLHGYYRARYSWMGGVPLQRRGAWVAGNARFGTMRLRLEPEVAYGPNEDHPIAVLHTQIDGFDNVVFGDNARITRTPLFAGDPSNTNVDGFDLADSLRLKRAWIEFLIPVGQIRIGRMPSNWGLGLLASDGNGLGEWGDPRVSSTFDRILFATRPLTVYNALSRGDARETPLIYALAYDKLVEDPVIASTDPPAFSDIRLGPVSSSYEQRSTFPLAFVSGDGNDVQELINALIWRDLDWNQTSSTDRLQLGFYYVWRWQKKGGRLAHLPTDAQASRIHILDWFWDMQVGLGHGRPSFFTTGEIVTIQGRSNTISLAGGCDDTTGICGNTRANIWGGVARVGLTRQDRWTSTLEWGFASGDGELFNSNKLSVRPLHANYRVGLLTYQVALKALTANGLGERVRPLWSDGGVWNSQYFNPTFRMTLLPGIEVHGGVLVSWAQKLLGTVYSSNRPLGESASCHGFDSDCFIGIEGDLALRFRWGPNDLMWWDTEFGIMRIGRALSGPDGLAQDILWTVQSRAAMQF